MSIPSSSTAVESVRAPGDFEAWERLKDDFAKAAEQYETDDIAATLPMLRQVLSECHRFLIQYDDPSVLFVSETTDVEPSPQLFTPSEERLARDWGFNNDEDGFFARPIISYRRGELTTAFHAILGITLFLFGNLVAQDSSLVLKNEPSNATDYWLAALDVFETGENLPSRTAGRSEAEDWRMAIVWGRTLVCLADEKISRSRQARKEAEEAGTEYSSFMCYDAFMAEEPKWPADSIFHAIAQRRPPVTRRMSLTYASANDVLTLAMDQFSRGIFHMPHAQSSHSHHFHCSSSSTHNPESSSFSRPKELFTIASEVLGVAERLEAAPERQYWASWADSVFNQMKMEVDMDAWRGPITSARGRCWLIMGSAKVEELESALERGDEAVLRSEDAEEAREGLAMAISFFERAKGSRTSTMLSEEDEDLQSLLAEALLTLANLTIDNNKREELYSRAQAEGGNQVVLELDRAREEGDVYMDES
ncbi:hypothetical protein GLOTRDRAFT_39779 [Gloeophyllum trabeum ATCC 11539]|uniref:Uncharacterized protein n=1 Tax=Gloeophyllum trabeum (strain ATCC 11539 / FP-39264 / Madison 617) TaxID=670483 RepID=S7Q888_GLOTA|nr:uncharacterized protein GLOTRDRAFT_39779 [Gloeophyllum trabeum ATCC 11539]EPQ56196.1 hypothetical protein GLOTRDRAFT_39779 [Gloeophyllum trabeum ATCC 11539]